MSKIRVFLYPEISDQLDANKIISRIAWYFWPHREKLEAVSVSVSKSVVQDCSIAPDLDPRVGDYLPQAKEWLKLVSNEELSKEILGGDPARDVFLIWDIRCEESLPEELSTAIKNFQKSGGFYRIDPERTRMEGSFLLWAGLNKFCDPKSLITEHSARFQRMATTVGRHKRAYVFGTGPTFSDFVRDHNFSDGLSIIANSIVKDKEALSILRPKIICAADPIYHAGASSYAGAFREELIDALYSTGAWFVCPLRDFPIYDSMFPANLRDRIVAIPFNDKKAPPVDLNDQFYFRPFPNVLTLGLLPLASTFAETISIVGCDGRKILDDSFFWSHDKKVQFNDKMAEIQAAHPAFFKIDYNDYYMDHCRDLEKVLCELEAAGRIVISETPSLIPALSHRFSSSESEPLACVAMLDPDAKDDWGHFLAYDKRLAVAVKEKGLDFALICRSELAESFRPESVDHFLPVFSVNSWTIGNKSPAKRSDILSFGRELDSALEQLERAYPKGSICVFFYVGSVEAAEVVEHLMMYRPRVRAVINLFWSYNFDQMQPAYQAIWRPQVQRQSAGNRMRVVHSTHQIAEEFKSDWGVDLPVLEHPSTTFGDDEALGLSKKPAALRTKRAFGQGGFNVLFPGGARKEKGFLLSVQACSLLAGKPQITPQLRARLDKVSGPELHRAFEALDRTGIEIIDGDLSDDEFVQMVASADVVVIPYFGEAFRRRTSGILVDAMLLGKPVVVLEGTWLADIVRSEGTGLVSEPTPEAVAEAVLNLLLRQNEFLAAIEIASKKYLDKNSWKALVANVLSLAGAEETKISVTKLAKPVKVDSESSTLSVRILSATGLLLLEPTEKNLKNLRALVAEFELGGAIASHAAAVIAFAESKVMKIERKT